MGVPKIFISHAYKDRLLVDAFVNLLTKAGVPEEQIVCSSTPGTQLYVGTSLYSELKKELTSENVFVIFMLSENFMQVRFASTKWELPGFKMPNARSFSCRVFLLPK